VDNGSIWRKAQLRPEGTENHRRKQHHINHRSAATHVAWASITTKPPYTGRRNLWKKIMSNSESLEHHIAFCNGTLRKIRADASLETDPNIQRDIHDATVSGLRADAWIIPGGGVRPA
jgi:hypothetical protein